jgi:enoyl-CoA hydratase
VTGTSVDYHLRDGVATVTMDDGKVNVLSPGMLAAVGAALDRASDDGAVVVLTGRDGAFSAGFDLAVLRAGGPEAVSMLLAGFELAERLLSFPQPVVVACSGHALAMGSFLLLSVDYRVGADGPYRIGANEVAIGLTMPRFGVEICRQRLTPACFNRAVVNAEIFSPADAVTAGFLDAVVAPSDLSQAARAHATGLAALDRRAHAATKLRARDQARRAVRAAIEADAVDLGPS